MVTQGEQIMARSKLLCFAALMRVSCEPQEHTGEARTAQRRHAARDAAPVGGVIDDRWSGVQARATPGWEKKEVDRLTRDARAGLFDAVYVADADRWSRDNTKSEEGLEAFRQHRVRFFVGVTEYNLHLPEHCLYL